MSGLGGAVLCVGEMVNTEDEDTRIIQINGLEKVPRGEVKPAGWRGGETCGGRSWALKEELPTSL